jgi:hypothetical protein
MLDHGGAGGVPGVDKDKRSRGMMELEESVGFLCLRHLCLLHVCLDRASLHQAAACRVANPVPGSTPIQLVFELFCVFNT